MIREGALFSILLGCVFWVIAIFGKNFTYKYGWHPAPLWYGRLVFGIVGLGFIFAGLGYLIGLLW